MAAMTTGILFRSHTTGAQFHRVEFRSHVTGTNFRCTLCSGPSLDYTNTIQSVFLCINGLFLTERKLKMWLNLAWLVLMVISRSRKSSGRIKQIHWVSQQEQKETNMARNQRQRQRRSRAAKEETRHKLRFRQDGEMHAKALKCLGDGHFACSCIDGIERLGIISGSVHRKVFVTVEDIVLLRLWDSSSRDNKVTIVHKYSADEARKLEQCD